MKYFFWVIVAFIIVSVFRQWFSFSLLTATDLPLAHPELLSEVGLLPYAWSTLRSGFYAPLLWPHFILTVPATILHQFLSLEWQVIERVLFFYPFLLLGTFSSWFLLQKVSPKNVFSPLTPFLYLINSYILMVVSGGQMQIALSYAIAPLIIAYFLTLGQSIIDNDQKVSVLRKSIISGLLFSVVGMLDIRIGYVVGIAVFVYLLVLFLTEKLILHSIGKLLLLFAFIPGVVTILTHAYWILPVALYGQNPIEQLGSAYSTVDALQFFSFTKFENSFALLHPYWPENVFGKVSFMNPLFLLIPLTVFSILLFLHRCRQHEKRLILYFLLLALCGVFLAKGANPPFENINIWMFTNIPGFQSFRDSTKFFVLIAISYAVIIPLTIFQVYEYVQRKKMFHKNKLVYALGLAAIIVIVGIHWQVGQMRGTFEKSEIPAEYQRFENMLRQDNAYSRTLWVPTLQRYSYYSTVHPPFSARDFFMVFDIDDVLSKMQESDVQKRVEEASIKYIVVPHDVTGDIFVRDRMYDESLYTQTVQELSEFPWLRRVKGYEKLVVFEVMSPRGHVFQLSDGKSVKNEMVNPTHFRLFLTGEDKGKTIVFTETFDPGWEIRSGGMAYSSKKYDKWNSFVIPETTNNEVSIRYKPQEWVTLGFIISTASAIAALFAIIVLRKKYD